AQGHVVARRQRLDQLVFQQQRFGFRARYGHIHAHDLREHRHDARVLRTAVEIAAHAVAQRAGLADVQQRVVGRVHAVHARGGTQLGRECLAIEGRDRNNGHSLIGTSLSTPLSGSRRSTVWESVSAIHTAPAPTARPAGPCRRRGKGWVVSSPPPRRNVRRRPLPVSAIHNNGASGLNAIACGNCRLACARGPSSSPKRQVPCPTRVCTRSPRSCNERIEDPSASATYSTCWTTATAVGWANAARWPLPSRSSMAPLPARHCRLRWPRW